MPPAYARRGQQPSPRSELSWAGITSTSILLIQAPASVEAPFPYGRPPRCSAPPAAPVLAPGLSNKDVPVILCVLVKHWQKLISTAGSKEAVMITHPPETPFSIATLITDETRSGGVKFVPQPGGHEQLFWFIHFLSSLYLLAAELLMCFPKRQGCQALRCLLYHFFGILELSHGPEKQTANTHKAKSLLPFTALLKTPLQRNQ